MKLSDDAFAQLVAEEVKNRLSPGQRDVLLERGNWDRWQRALLALSENLFSQLENIDMDAEADHLRYQALGRSGRALVREAAAAYSSKRTNVERFKFHVDKRLDQVGAMVKTGEPMDMSPYEIASLYRRAIMKHRELLVEYDMEDTAIDRALWAALDNKWEFDGVTVDAL